MNSRFWLTSIFQLSKTDPEYKIVAHFNISALQNPEFKISANFKILAFKNPQFNILADFRV